MFNKAKDIKKMLESKAYILVTDREAILAGDLTGLSRVMRLHALHSVKKNLESVIKRYEKEEKDGGNPKRRKVSRSNK